MRESYSKEAEIFINLDNHYHYLCPKFYEIVFFSLRKILGNKAILVICRSGLEANMQPISWQKMALAKSTMLRAAF